jgi:hypothetical protein
MGLFDGVHLRDVIVAGFEVVAPKGAQKAAQDVRKFHCAREPCGSSHYIRLWISIELTPCVLLARTPASTQKSFPQNASARPKARPKKDASRNFLAALTLKVDE